MPFFLFLLLFVCSLYVLDLWSRIPTIGVAKTLACVDGLTHTWTAQLCQDYLWEAGDAALLIGVSGKCHGAVMRGSNAHQDAIYYVSQGHKINLATSIGTLPTTNVSLTLLFWIKRLFGYVHEYRIRRRRSAIWNLTTIYLCPLHSQIQHRDASFNCWESTPLHTTREQRIETEDAPLRKKTTRTRKAAAGKDASAKGHPLPPDTNNNKMDCLVQLEK